MTFADHLAGGATTLARCWQLDRADGVSLGFTDHSRALSFDGVTFEPDTGFTASQLAQDTGITIDDAEVSGALSSDRITLADIRAGTYDAATVTFMWVNWRNVTERQVISVFRLGEIETDEGEITAGMDGQAIALQSERALILSRGSCRHRFGDAGCGLDLSQAAFRAAGAVAALVTDRAFTVAGAGFVDGWASRGSLIWDSGANAGQTVNVRDHRVGSETIVELFLPPVSAIQAGDAFTLVAGCDLTFQKCGVFFNRVNFGGAPHMPADNRVIESYPVSAQPANSTPTPANVVYPVSKLRQFQ